MSLIEADRKYESITLNDIAEIEAQHPTAAADNAKKISIILRVAPVLSDIIV